MQNFNNIPQLPYSFKSNDPNKISQASYRGFVSIDQEMEREIAMKFFDPSKKNTYSQKGFVYAKG